MGGERSCVVEERGAARAEVGGAGGVLETAEEGARLV